MDTNKFFNSIDRTSALQLLFACVLTAWYESFIDDSELNFLLEYFSLEDLF